MLSLSNLRLDRLKQVRASQDTFLEDVGRAHHQLCKSANTPELSYSLAGRIFLSKTGWLLLSVPNALVRGLFDALHEPGVELPFDSKGDLHGHISIMSADEVKRIGADKITERGHTAHFSLGPIKTVRPSSWDDISRCWYVTVQSPELAAIRRSYGLESKPHEGEYDFHITFAVLRKKTLFTNALSKAGISRFKAPTPGILQRLFSRLNFKTAEDKEAIESRTVARSLINFLGSNRQPSLAATRRMSIAGIEPTPVNRARMFTDKLPDLYAGQKSRASNSLKTTSEAFPIPAALQPSLQQSTAQLTPNSVPTPGLKTPVSKKPWFGQSSPAEHKPLNHLSYTDDIFDAYAIPRDRTINITPTWPVLAHELGHVYSPQFGLVMEQPTGSIWDGTHKEIYREAQYPNEVLANRGSIRILDQLRQRFPDAGVPSRTEYTQQAMAPQLEGYRLVALRNAMKPDAGAEHLPAVFRRLHNLMGEKGMLPGWRGEMLPKAPASVPWLDRIKGWYGTKTAVSSLGGRSTAAPGLDIERPLDLANEALLDECDQPYDTDEYETPPSLVNDTEASNQPGAGYIPLPGM